ncbi:hypothetical protein EV715DRAFT_187809, partial [Schizophyllum commune]
EKSQPRHTATDTNYEQKYAPDAYGEELSARARVWRVYNDESQIADGEMVTGLNGTLDVLLVFAGLFSAVVTTFVSQSSQKLDSDYAQITTSLVYELVLLQRAVATGASAGDIPEARLVPDSKTYHVADLWVNGLWLTSLTLALLTALISVLAKQWIQHYNLLSKGSPRDRACIRQYRFRSFQRWRVPAIVGSLPVLLTVALLLFFAGLAVYVAPLNFTISIVIVGLSAAIFLLYCLTTALPIFVPQCAYKTPLAEYIIAVAHPILQYSVIYPIRQIQHFYEFVHKQARAETHWRRDFRSLVRAWSWTRRRLAKPQSLQDREQAEVERQREAMMDGALEWLVSSSLNTSAASVATQAASAFPIDADISLRRAQFCRTHPRDQIITLNIAYMNSPANACRDVDRIERLMRALLHTPSWVRTWSARALLLWAHLLDRRQHIPHAHTRAALCVMQLARFCDEDEPLRKGPALRRALDALDMVNWDAADLQLHPAIWRELKLLTLTCLLLSSAPNTARTKFGLFEWEPTYETVVDADIRSQYTPAFQATEKACETTAITSKEYFIGRKWEEGRAEMLDNLTKLRQLLLDSMAEIE